MFCKNIFCSQTKYSGMQVLQPDMLSCQKRLRQYLKVLLGLQDASANEVGIKERLQVGELCSAASDNKLLT